MNKSLILLTIYLVFSSCSLKQNQFESMLNGGWLIDKVVYKNNVITDSLIFNMITLSNKKNEIEFPHFRFNIMSEENSFNYQILDENEKYYLVLDGNYFLGSKFTTKIEKGKSNKLHLIMFNDSTLIECQKFDIDWRKIIDGSDNQ